MASSSTGSEAYSHCLDCEKCFFRFFFFEKTFFKNIEKQLNQKTISFINDIDNVYISHEEETIYLNKIFKWFKKDFKNVIQFITEFLIEDIDYDRIKNYKIKYYKYDWSSNQSSN